MPPPEGVDVSSYDHPGGRAIDWPAVARSGRTFAVVKISEGTGYVNPFARDDVRDATAAGLNTRGYHFARPLANHPHAEWQYANSHRPGAGFVIDLDLEDGQAMGWARLAAWAKEWLGLEPAARLYVNGSYLRGLAPYGAPFGHGLWFARPGVANPGVACEVWQYGQGPVPGIARAACDLNRLMLAPDPPAPAPGSHVIATSRVFDKKEGAMIATDIEVTTDAQGRGWCDLPGIDPKHVVSIMPDGAFPFPGGYTDTGEWEVATGSQGEAVAVVTDAKPSFGVFARVWSVES